MSGHLITLTNNRIVYIYWNPNICGDLTYLTDGFRSGSAPSTFSNVAQWIGCNAGLMHVKQILAL